MSVQAAWTHGAAGKSQALAPFTGAQITASAEGERWRMEGGIVCGGGGGRRVQSGGRGCVRWGRTGRMSGESAGPRMGKGLVLCGECAPSRRGGAGDAMALSAALALAMAWREACCARRDPSARWRRAAWRRRSTIAAACCTARMPRSLISIWAQGLGSGKQSV